LTSTSSLTSTSTLTSTLTSTSSLTSTATGTGCPALQSCCTSIAAISGLTVQECQTAYAAVPAAECATLVASYQSAGFCK
jgi:hypothetical protein